MTKLTYLPPTSPPWIYGMHDPGEWREIFRSAQKTGWVMFDHVLNNEGQTEETISEEISNWADDKFGVLVRLVNAPPNADGNGGGAIPKPDNYDAFAERCADFVKRTPDCHIWFIGNEMNIDQNWPDGQKITPENYADCFNKVYAAIKAVRPEVWVIPSGLDPRHKQESHFQYEDALRWFQEMLKDIESMDGFDIHSCFPLTEGRIDQLSEVNQSDEEETKNEKGTYLPSKSRLYELLVNEFRRDDLIRLFASLGVEYYSFRNMGSAGRVKELILLAERESRFEDLVKEGISKHHTPLWNDALKAADFNIDWIENVYTFDQFLPLVPHKWRNLPVFLTQTTPPSPWPEKSDGWMEYAYAQVNRWNQSPDHQPVTALLPYRWGKKPNILQQTADWYLFSKESYHDDLRKALERNYGWKGYLRELPTDPPIYKSEVSLIGTLPDKFWPGDHFNVKVKIKNVGNRTWDRNSMELSSWIARGGSLSGSSSRIKKEMGPGDEEIINTSFDIEPNYDELIWKLHIGRFNPFKHKGYSHFPSREKYGIQGGELRYPINVSDLSSLDIEKLLEKLATIKKSEEIKWILSAIGRKFQSHDEKELKLDLLFNDILDLLVITLLKNAKGDLETSKLALEALFYLYGNNYRKDKIESRVKEAFNEEGIDWEWVYELVKSDQNPEYSIWLNTLLSPSDELPSPDSEASLETSQTVEEQELSGELVQEETSNSHTTSDELPSPDGKESSEFSQTVEEQELSRELVDEETSNGHTTSDELPSQNSEASLETSQTVEEQELSGELVQEETSNSHTTSDELPSPDGKESSEFSQTVEEQELSRELVDGEASKSNTTPVEADVSQTTIVVIKPELREEETMDIPLMDIHITPRANSQQWKYQVVLTLKPRLDSPSAQFEGPLLWNPNKRKTGPELGKILFDALFHTQAEEGKVATRDAYSQLIGMADETGEFRIQVRINNESLDLHQVHWEYLWDEGLFKCEFLTKHPRMG